MVKLGLSEQDLVSRSLTPSVKIMLGPVGGLIVVCVFLFLVATNGYAKIQEILKEIDKSRKSEMLLEEKLSILQEATIDVENFSSKVLVALPAENPSIIFLSQIKKTAEEKRSEVTRVDIGGEIEPQDPTLAKRSRLKITVESGSLSDMIDYVKSIRDLAPISSLDAISLSENGGIVTGVIDLSVYWSALPTRISGVTEPIVGLSNDEKTYLEQFTVLTQPATVAAEPSQPTERSDPFNSL